MTKTITNREVYFRDPTTFELLNNGVSKVSEVGDDQRQLNTVRFELEHFVCDGEYARGLERILKAYLDGLGKSEQKAVWVSGFFGSGKSHLVKVLRYLWEDYRFPDGATARSLVTLPTEIDELLIELTNRSKPLGGLRAAAGTLGAGSMDSVRLAFIQLVLRSAGLPEDLAHAKFLLWLRSSDLEAIVTKSLDQQGCRLTEEVANFNYSTALAEALLTADPKYGTVANVQEVMRTGFPEITSPTMAQVLDFVRQVFGDKGNLPCTLLVVDEIQQFVGDKIQRSMDLQEIAEHCSTQLNQRLLFVGTGQSALTTTESLKRLQARFGVRVQLSDADVESVIRKTVLRKKPEKQTVITTTMAANEGELSRHLENTRLAATHEDEQFFVADYPLLPTRRRFWEKVLRNSDHSGTQAQLRNQLQVVFAATRQTADAPVGTVVPADFIYDQISTDLLNSGELEREYDEIICSQRDGSEEGKLRSSLCALIFLIGKLPRTPGVDDGVRATADTLIDLLVSDLKSDRPKLEQQVPKLLKQLVDKGQMMQLESEYRLQTREGVIWTHEFNRRRTATLADVDGALNAKRAELLRAGVKQALKPVSLQQGNSHVQRKIRIELSSSRPSGSSDEIMLWIRDGWSDDDKSVLNDARAAGVDSPLLFAYIPRQHHEELKQAIASHIAAEGTLGQHGAATTPEAIEARKSIETHFEVAQSRIKDLLGHIIGASKVFLGGGQEANGVELADKVQDAAESAMVRLFPHFSEADHSNWGQVVARARTGDVGALASVGYPGDVTKHPVSRRVLDFIGAGKKGKEIREYFEGASFGWPTDAVNGVLFVMLAAGNLRATVNGQPVQASLPANQIGVATFYVDVPPLGANERLALKALFPKAGVTVQSGKEAEGASPFLQRAHELAAAAGGRAPRPDVPDTQEIRALQSLSGNAQLLQIFEQKEALTSKITLWKKNAETIAKREPTWERLLELHGFAAGLPEAEEVGKSVSAIIENRSLLAEPDPIPSLTRHLTTGLRAAISKSQEEIASAFREGEKKLAAVDSWKRLTDEQRQTLSSAHQLHETAKDPLGKDDEILASLRRSNLADRRNLLDAVPQRFARALDEASRLLEPKAQRVVLAGATIRDGAELDRWLEQTRKHVEEKLKDGPVIL